jgi:hypothetical protein
MESPIQTCVGSGRLRKARERERKEREREKREREKVGRVIGRRMLKNPNQDGGSSG